MEIICSAIRRSTDLNVSVNKREDIVLNDLHKISGTAAKLGKDTAYHHCTVLVNVNECVLHDALDSKAVSLHSLIRGVLIQSCSAGAKHFTNYVFCHVQFNSHTAA